MEHELIERYLYAVTKQLPAKSRRDIERELRSLIGDMLEERCGEIAPTERDIRVVLTELGTPTELAQQYGPDHDRYLIGPCYYAKYRLVLKIVLHCVLFGITVAGIIDTVSSETQIGFPLLLEWLGTVISALLSAFAFITLLFAVFERRGVHLDNVDDSLSSLPPVPQKSELVSKGESIAGIVFSILFTVLFLTVPQIFSGVFEGGAVVLPVFQIDRIRELSFLVVGLIALSVAGESFQLYEGRYTPRLAAVTCVLNGIAAVLGVAFLTDARLWNPAILPYLNELTGNDAFLSALFGRIPLLILVVFLLALVLDAGTTVWKAFRYGKETKR